MNCWNAAQRVAQLLQSNQQEEIIDILEPYSLEQRRFIISINYDYSSLLFIAVKKKCVSLVTYFLESCGADPNSFGWMHGDKLTCLAGAAIINSEILVNILLTHGANTEILCSSDEVTALYHACRNGRLKIAKLLIKHGANVNSCNSGGQTCLMESIHYFKLCKYLISVGANLNLVNDLGETSLTQAFQTGRKKVISLLLNCENTVVRLQTHLEVNVLHLAVQFSSENVVNKIIRKGSYSNDEVIKVYEWQSCLFYVNNFHEESKKLWEKALKLRVKPSDTPMFQNPHPAGKLQEVIDVFNADDIPALLYLESAPGLNNISTLIVYTRAARNVNETDKYIILCRFFFKIVYSLEDKYFFLAFYQAKLLMCHFFNSDDLLKLKALKVFEMLVEYIEEIHARFERMTPQERTPHGCNVESFLYILIELFCQLNENFSGNLYSFYEGINRIITIDLRGLSQKSLLQLSAGVYEHLIEPIFLEGRADVNSTDNEGKTVLHDLVELGNASTELVKIIIDNGFDFHLVKCDEYCLPCRMEREGILSNPVKHISLQCLAAKAFYKKTMNCFSDVPHHLTAIVNSHLYL